MNCAQQTDCIADCRRAHRVVLPSHWTAAAAVYDRLENFLNLTAQFNYVGALYLQSQILET